MLKKLGSLVRWALILLFLAAIGQQMLTIFMDLLVFFIVFLLIFALLPANMREKALKTAKNTVKRG